MPYANPRKRYAERKAVGLCVRCPDPAIAGQRHCAACADKEKNRLAKSNAERKAVGLCCSCSAPAVAGKVQCAACADKIKAINAERRTAAVADMYAAQGGKCAGCQHPYPQRNLAIDHIIPRAKGGDDAPSNKQLLCHYCNSVKHTRSQSELLAELRERGIIDADGNNIEVEYSG